MEKEVSELSSAISNPERPFVSILGGLKVSDKIGVIENLLTKVDKILIGGAMACTFFKAMGYEIGESKCEDDKLEEANRILKLAEEKNIMQDVSDRYDRVVRVLGIETVDAAVQQDICNEKALEEKQRMEQMPKGSIHERLAWGIKKSEMENQQRKKNKSKNREMER